MYNMAVIKPVVLEICSENKVYNKISNWLKYSYPERHDRTQDVLCENMKTIGKVVPEKSHYGEVSKAKAGHLSIPSVTFLN